MGHTDNVSIKRIIVYYHWLANTKSAETVVNGYRCYCYASEKIVVLRSVWEIMILQDTHTVNVKLVMHGMLCWHMCMCIAMQKYVTDMCQAGWMTINWVSVLGSLHLHSGLPASLNAIRTCCPLPLPILLAHLIINAVIDTVMTCFYALLVAFCTIQQSNITKSYWYAMNKPAWQDKACATHT